MSFREAGHTYPKIAEISFQNDTCKINSNSHRAVPLLDNILVLKRKKNPQQQWYTQYLTQDWVSAASQWSRTRSAYTTRSCCWVRPAQSLSPWEWITLHASLRDWVIKALYWVHTETQGDRMKRRQTPFTCGLLRASEQLGFLSSYYLCCCQSTLCVQQWVGDLGKILHHIEYNWIQLTSSEEILNKTTWN